MTLELTVRKEKANYVLRAEAFGKFCERTANSYQGLVKCTVDSIGLSVYKMAECQVRLEISQEAEKEMGELGAKALHTIVRMYNHHTEEKKMIRMFI